MNTRAAHGAVNPNRQNLSQHCAGSDSPLFYPKRPRRHNTIMDCSQVAGKWSPGEADESHNSDRANRTNMSCI